MDELAATLRPLPAEVARLSERADAHTERLDFVVAELRDMRAEMREMRTELRTEMGAMRQDFSAMQRQLTQIGWGLALAVIAVLLAFLLGG